MAYLLASICLFIIIVLAVSYLMKTSTRYVQIPYEDLSLMRQCFQEAEEEIRIYLQNSSRVEYMNPVLLQDLGKKIRSKMLLGKSICKTHMKDRV